MPNVQQRYEKTIKVICDLLMPAYHKNQFLAAMNNWFKKLDPAKKSQLNRDLKQGFALGYQGAKRLGLNVTDQTTIRSFKRALVLLDCHLGNPASRTDNVPANILRDRVQQKARQAVQKAPVGPNFARASVRLTAQNSSLNLLNIAKTCDQFRNKDYLSTQDDLQDYFGARLMGDDSTRGRVCQQAVLRMGNIKWEGPSPTATPPYSKWQKNNGLTNERPQMNCWEGILYLAYQAGIYKKFDLYNYFINDKKGGMRQVGHTAFNLLAGIKSVGNVGTPSTSSKGKLTTNPSPGDLVIWSAMLPETMSSNVIGIGHIALYLGDASNKKWVWHNGFPTVWVPGCMMGHTGILPFDHCRDGAKTGKFYTAPWA